MNVYSSLIYSSPKLDAVEMSISWWMDEKLLYVHIMQCYAKKKGGYEHTKHEWFLKIWRVEEDRHITALTQWYFFALPLNDIYLNPSLCASSIRNISINLSWVKTCPWPAFSQHQPSVGFFSSTPWSPIFCEALDKSTSFSGHLLQNERLGLDNCYGLQFQLLHQSRNEAMAEVKKEL